MRLAYYASASSAAAAACLLKAFHQRPNFYSATVYLSQSNACILILTNLVLVLACSAFYGLQRLLYGPLRPIEIEQLSEKAWYAVLDTLLAMPSFREDVGGWLLCMFVLLLAGKVWGWIGEGRVDVLEQGQPISGSKRLFHMRLATSLVASVMFDVIMLDYCVETVMADPRPGMMVIFTFEFAILGIFSSFTLSRYLLSLIQARIELRQMKEAIETRKNEIRAERAAARQREAAEGEPTTTSPADEEPIEVDENEVDVPGWEEKRRYLFALEVFTDFIKLVIYVVFFTISITFNGLPMHIMRDVYMTFASFSKRVADYVAYQKATSDMNTRYPDATTEEIRGDACIVCREGMVAWEQPAAPAQAPAAGQQAQPAPTARRDEGLRAKKLPCGHILHLRCLKAWLERQQVCPTCRRPVVQATEAPAQAPGQPRAAAAGAAVGNPAAPGAPQPPNVRLQRPNRARIFNFGPLRVGLINGPGDQLQNVIDGLRNQPGAQQNLAGANANQPGPNHLGLQVPYLPNAPGGPAATGSAANSLPTQMQLLQVEQRLMQDAYNLGVEQQQLATLRLMEAELARLRAQQVPTQPPVGTETAAMRQATSRLGIPPAHNAPAAPQRETLRGSAQQQMSAGHDALPQGMVLPDGWSIMPLQRQPGLFHALARNSGAQQSAQPPPNATEESSSSTNTVQTQGPSQPQPASTTTAQQPRQVDAGPRDDAGSPLFLPTATLTVPPTDPPRSSLPAATPTAPSTNTQSSSATSEQQGVQSPSTSAAAKAPWAVQSGWDFGDRGSSAAKSSEQIADSGVDQHASTEQSLEERNQEHEGKGKGRAVRVEADPDDGV